MSELDPRLERWIVALRRRPEPSPDALGRLRAAIRREGRGRRDRRVIRLTPAAAAASALAVAAVTSLVWLFADAPRAAAPAEETTPVQFVLHAPNARSVTLVGDFNDWDRSAVPMAETGDGVWSVVVSLPPGTVRYSFLVDGHEWRADPAAARAPGDFGRPSSIAFIGDPGAET